MAARIVVRGVAFTAVLALVGLTSGGLLPPQPRPMPPIAQDDVAATTEGVAVIIPVLANDASMTGGQLTLDPWLIWGAMNGATVANLDGTITYTPNPGFVGVDTFAYEALDGLVVSMPAMVTVTVEPGGPAGFITGGGWVAGPIVPTPKNPNARGKTQLTVNCKNVAEEGEPPVLVGKVQVVTSALKFRFRSVSLDWMVVDGQNAWCGGTGTVNGEGQFQFVLAVFDGRSKRIAPDAFRFLLWDPATGVVVWDNQPGDPPEVPAVQALTRGNLTVHTLAPPEEEE